MSRARLIETFNTHRMSAAVLQAVATARELELAEVMQAVRRAAGQPQQTAQHLIVYGERGSGKSFLMRLVEIEIERLAREQGLPVASALLPEEQYNIRSAPQLIQAIAAKVRGAGWEASAYAMDFRPLPEAWEAAVAELEAALDQRFGQGLGLVVAMVENFDTLARNLFGAAAIAGKKTASARAIEQGNAEQLLRKLMNCKGSRLMLIAAATGTVDQDYERPLFQAFKTLDLRIWSSDDCIAYFNRRRELERQAALSPQEEARARAIAEFIGGNPRLAQLLGEALVTPDARGIAATLDALSDHLADYYRHRLDDLPPQSAALLDSLIRKGEPCTQSELAVRVGAASQAQIADAFSYLLSSRLLAAGPDRPGSGKLYRLRDRLFVHFYRRRYGEPEQALGLAPIAELLASFFTQREREQQARRHLEAGEWADARLYALNSPFLSEPSDGFCWYRDGEVTGTPSELFRWAGLVAAGAAEAQAELKLHPDLAVKRWKDAANRASSGLGRTAALSLEANALSRCQMDNEAEAILTEALARAEAEGDIDGQILALDGRASFAISRRKDRDTALDLFARAGALAEQAQDDGVRAAALLDRAWILGKTGRYLEAIAASDWAAERASSVGSQRLQARARGFNAFSLNRLRSYGEAARVAEQAADLAAATGMVHYQMEALEHLGFALFNSDKHEAAESIYGKAAQLAAEIGNERSQSYLLCPQSYSLRQLKRPEEALATAREAAKLAAKLGEPDVQGLAMSIAGQVLIDLGQYAEADTILEEAAQLAVSAGDVALQLDSLMHRVWSLSMLDRHEAAIELAQAVAALSVTAGDAGAQATALRLKGWSLDKLGRTEAASGAFDGAFGVAKSAGQKQQLIVILKTQFNTLGSQKANQTLALARETIAETRDMVSKEHLWAARRIFFEAAARTAAVDVVEAFEACLAEATTDGIALPLADMLDQVLAAVAYNGVWDAFTACLLRHSQAAPFLRSLWVFAQVGRVWSEQVKADGRAHTYAAIARQLPAIVRLTRLLPRADGEAMAHGHLRGLISGLLSHCDDAGFLQDLAGLLEEGFGGQVDAEVQRIRAFAQVLAAPDKEKVLQRLDPDMALAIRRILGLPEPDDLLARRGRRKGR